MQPKSQSNGFLEVPFSLLETRLDVLSEEGCTDRESLRLLRGYLSNNRTRLAEGRAIGSGQVEGACKNMIGKAVKADGFAVVGAAAQSNGDTLFTALWRAMGKMLDTGKIMQEYFNAPSHFLKTQSDCKFFLPKLFVFYFFSLHLPL